MKRISLLIVMFVIFSALMSNAIAEQIMPESILFRSFPWFESEANVKTAVENEGFTPSWYRGVEESARIESWYREFTSFYADLNIYDAGVILRYDNVPVAGYISDMKLSFAYPIENGRVNYDTEVAQFYMAEYRIKDLEDMEGAYTDLVGKISLLYGKPEDNSSFNRIYEKYSPKGSLWTAKDGSLVWVAMYWNSYEEKYDEIKIIYAAPDTDWYSNTLDLQIKSETAANEAAKREENSQNMDGL